MKKKKLNILVAVFVSLAVVAISVTGIVSEFFNPHIWYKEHVYMFGGSAINECIVKIESKEELISYFGNKYNDMFNEAFFEEKMLIDVVINKPDSGYEYCVSSVYLKNGVLNIDIYEKRYLPAFQALHSWEVLIEVKKSDIKGITGIQKNITEVNLHE